MGNNCRTCSRRSVFHTVYARWVLFFLVTDVIKFYFGDMATWFELYRTSTLSPEEGFCKIVAAFFDAALAMLLEEPPQPLALPPEVSLNSKKQCMRVAKACHRHPQVKGCLVMQKGRIIHSTFDPSITLCLSLLEHSDGTCHLGTLLKKRVSFRLPMWVTLMDLYPDQTLWSKTGEKIPEERHHHQSVQDEESHEDSEESNVPVNSTPAEVVAALSDFSNKVHKTASERSRARQRRQHIRQREREQVVDSLRHTTFVMAQKKRQKDETEGPQHKSRHSTALYRQSFGLTELIVGLQEDEEISKELLIDLWNIGIAALAPIYRFC